MNPACARSQGCVNSPSRCGCHWLGHGTCSIGRWAATTCTRSCCLHRVLARMWLQLSHRCTAGWFTSSRVSEPASTRGCCSRGRLASQSIPDRRMMQYRPPGLQGRITSARCNLRSRPPRRLLRDLRISLPTADGQLELLNGCAANRSKTCARNRWRVELSTRDRIGQAKGIIVERCRRRLVVDGANTAFAGEPEVLGRLHA